MGPTNLSVCRNAILLPSIEWCHPVSAFLTTEGLYQGYLLTLFLASYNHHMWNVLVVVESLLSHCHFCVGVAYEEYKLSILFIVFRSMLHHLQTIAYYFCISL